MVPEVSANADRERKVREALNNRNSVRLHGNAKLEVARMCRNVPN